MFVPYAQADWKATSLLQKYTSITFFALVDKDVTFIDAEPEDEMLPIFEPTGLQSPEWHVLRVAPPAMVNFVLGKKVGFLVNAAALVTLDNSRRIVPWALT